MAAIMNLPRSLFGRSVLRTNPSNRFRERKSLALEPLEVRALLAAVPLVTATTRASTFVPATDADYLDLSMDWLAPGFDDSAWHTTPFGGANGVGFDGNAPPSEYAPYIGYDTATEMLAVTPAAYVRYEFNATDVDSLGALVLSMRFDDGFIAWLNGTEVMRVNAPVGVFPTRNAGAASVVGVANANYTTYDIAAYSSALQQGENVLAIRGFNLSRVDNDFLIQAKLDAEVVERFPVAVNDEVTVDESSTTLIPVLANDIAGNFGPFDPASVTVKQGPAHGTTSVNSATGEVTYTPAPNFRGTDAFTYTVRDNFGAITTTSVVQPTTAPHKTLVPADDRLARTWTGGAEPFHETGWTAGTGGVGYDHDATTNYLPQISDNVDARVYDINQSIYIRIPFTLDDPITVSAMQLLMRYDDGFVAYINGVEVASANRPADPLFFNSGAWTTHFDADSLLQETFNIDLTGVPLRSGHNANILAIQGLNLGVRSSDLLIQPELKVTLRDAHESNAATVTVHVAPAGPTAVDDFATTPSTAAVTIPVLANDLPGVDPIDPATVQVTQLAAHGTTTVDPATGAITYTPTPGFSGQDSFFYQVRDTSTVGSTIEQSLVGAASSNRFLIPSSDALGFAWTQATFNDAAWTAGSNGIGYDNAPAPFDYNQYIGVPTPEGQTPVTVYGRWKFSVGDPAAVDSLKLTIRADDGFVAYINGVRVAASNAPPQPLYNSQSLAVGPNDSTVISTPQVFDIDLAGLALLAGSDNVLAIHALNSGSFSSDLLAQPILTATIAGQGRLSNAAEVAVTVEPSDAPASLADTYTVDEDDELFVSAPFGVLANDLPSAAALTASVVTGPAHGALILSTDGSFRYTPNPNFAGIDEFTYRATDGQNRSATGTVALQILPSPDAIIARPDAYVATANTPLAVGRENEITEDLVPAGATWSYNDSGDSLGTAWHAVEYDDSTWSSGPAQLGYGDGDEATVVSFGDDPTSRHTTTYFRRDFTLDNPSSVTMLTLGLQRDDGAVVYLNGVEIVRSNLPSDADNDTFASSAVTGAAENEYLPYEINPPLLVPGVNTIAVEVHQSSAGSADLSFDLQLEGVSRPADHDGVLRNDEDPDGGPPLSAVLVAAPAHGALDLASDGSFLYLPDADFVGTDTFTYRAVSGNRKSGPTTVFINVAPAGNSPDADLNGDEQVDRADLAILMRHFGKTGAAWAEGDIDHNGKVDLMDVCGLQTQFTMPAASAPAAIIAQARSRAVEPATNPPGAATLRARRAAPRTDNPALSTAVSPAAADAVLSALTAVRSTRRTH
jgi:hypothetical protein